MNINLLLFFYVRQYILPEQLNNIFIVDTPKRVISLQK